MPNELPADVVERIDFAVEKIKKQYLSNDNNIPWLIGYSGGKDSTVTAQLVYRSLIELRESGKKLNRKIYIFSSDTMIENPIVKALVDKNIMLINQKAQKLKLPIQGLILRPEIDRSFWVNIIGRGYPTPNTMFRWCTDRLKIEPANNFVHKCVDANGEVIMVLGVREGESDTRDRVLKSHEIEGDMLMKHTTLANAFIFPPIKHLSTLDVFSYIAAYESPWGGNNKELYMMYEESGGGECPIFLSADDKTSKNSCGNTRMGCWVCTVVSKDKSLSGFISTGFYDTLIPLLDFRNWIVSIRDKDSYRYHFRNNGTTYFKRIEKKISGESVLLNIPKKGDREQIILTISNDGETIVDSNEYRIIDKETLSEYMVQNNLSFKSSELSYLILKDRITDEYYKIGDGPFTDEARKEIFKRLIETEKKYNEGIKTEPIQLISDVEIIEIKKIWKKNSIDTKFIDEVLISNGRKPVNLVQDSFEKINEKYESKIKKILKEKSLDYELVNKLVLSEKDMLGKEDRKSMQDIIYSAFNADKINY